METSPSASFSALRADNGLGVGRHTLGFVLSILLSVFLHGGAMVALEKVTFGAPGAEAESVRGPAELPPLRIETFVREVGLAQAEAASAPDPVETARQAEGAAVAAADAIPLPTPPPPATPSLPPPPAASAPFPGLAAPRQQILAVPDLPAAPEPRWVIPADIPRAPKTPDLAESVLDMPLGAMHDLSRPMSGDSANLAQAVQALGEGESVSPPPSLPETPPRAASTVDAVVPDMREAAPAFRAIDDRLSLSLVVHEPKDDPDYRYFRLQILRKPESALAVMPKDVVLIQDVSGSIGADRLAQGKAALKAALANVLRAGDRFNVFAFRDVTLTPSNAWLTYGPDTRARAETFIDSLRAIGNTDLFLLLQDILTLPRDPARPTIAVVVTDGEPTVGVTGTTRIIGEFTRMNQGRIAVYAFGAKRRDPYFLDMLCYANRGENTSASGDVSGLAAELAPVFESIRNPVMKDLTLTFDAKSGGEIHPRALTHLYADRPLVVYGRVPKSTNGVTCQLTGRSAEAPYDAVFAFDFAEATHTARDLRRAWAARAMFDLLAEYAENPSAALLRRIETFSRAYGVPNPYRRGK